MVPTSLILDLLIKAMATPSGTEGIRRFLVDGFPRKLDQLQEFEARVRVTLGEAHGGACIGI